MTATTGDWRVDLTWRALGWALYQATLQYLADRPLQAVVTDFPWSLKLLALSALALVAFGARLPVLVLTATSSLYVTGQSLAGSNWWTKFPAEEFPLLVAFSVGALAAVAAAALSQRAWIGSVRFRKECTRIQILVARSIIVVALGFAGLAKLNRDFFDPSVSCTQLTERLDDWWGIARHLPTQLGPGAVVVLELAVPLLLCILPRLGILMAIVLAFGIGHIGPTAFNATAVALSMSFLRAADRRVVAEWLRRGWPVLLVAAMLVMPLSSNTYLGEDKPWHVFASFEAFCLFLAFVALAALARSLRRVFRMEGLGDAWGMVGDQARWPLPHGRAGRVVVATVMLVLFVNGMAPYLGLKLRFSHAMLSNLRVDTNRWNSYVMPRWLYLPRHDPFVHVTRIELDPRHSGGGYRGVRKALYRPDEFRQRCAWLRERGQDFLIEYSYRGVEYRSQRALGDDAFWSRLRELPDTRLVQEELVLDGPQECKH